MKIYNFTSESSLKNFMKKSMTNEVYNSIFPLPLEFTIKFDTLGCATFHDEKDNIFADYSTFPDESLHFRTVLNLFKKKNDFPVFIPKQPVQTPNRPPYGGPGFRGNRDKDYVGIPKGPDTVEEVIIDGKRVTITRPGPC